MLSTGVVVKLSLIDTSDLDFISRSGGVYQVREEDYLFLPRDSSSGNAPLSLLNSQFLEVPVLSVILVKNKWSSGVTSEARAKVQIFIGMLEDWTFPLSTFLTVEVNFLKLWVNLRPLSNHSLNLDQLPQMHVSQVSEFILERQVSNPHKHFFEDLLILRENFRH